MVRREGQGGGGGVRSWLRRTLGVLAAFLAAALVVIVAIASGPASASRSGVASVLVSNPNVDPGTSLSGRAADFTLTDQFGQPVSLHQFRGRVDQLRSREDQFRRREDEIHGLGDQFRGPDDQLSSLNLFRIPLRRRVRPRPRVLSAVRRGDVPPGLQHGVPVPSAVRL